MPENVPNPEQVDIQLSLLGADSKNAISDLKNTVSELTRVMGAMGDFAASQQERLGQISRKQQGDQQAGGPSRPTVGRATSAPSTTRSTPDADQTRAKLGAREDPPRLLGPDGKPISGASEPSSAARDFDRQAQEVTPGRVRRMINLASTPSQWGSATKGAWEGIQGITRDDQGNIQQSPLQRFKNVGEVTAGIPFALHQYSQYPGISQATSAIQQSGILSPIATRSQGNLVGYPTAGGTSIGPFQVPFTSPAQQYGLQQSLDTLVKGATTPGVSVGQIADIKGAIQQSGFGGEQNMLDDLTNRITSITTQHAGGNAGTVMPFFDRAVRYGGTSLDDLNKTLNDTGDAARTAKMSVDEYRQAQLQTAEELMTQGGVNNINTAAQKVNQFSKMTGLPPQAYSEMSNNKFTQASLMGRTGLLPFEQGNLPPDMITGATAGMAGKFMAMFRNARGGKGKDVLDPNTGKMLHYSANQLALADTAHTFGMKPDILKNILNNQKYYGARAGAQRDIGAYDRHMADPRYRAAHPNGDPAGWRKVTDTMMKTHYLAPQHMRAELAKISAQTQGKPGKRGEILQSKIKEWSQKATKSSSHETKIVLSGDAARWFRILGPKASDKRDRNSGRVAVNVGSPKNHPIGPHETTAPDPSITLDPIQDFNHLQHELGLDF